jgi:hypothetical protein
VRVDLHDPLCQAVLVLRAAEERGEIAIAVAEPRQLLRRHPIAEVLRVYLVLNTGRFRPPSCFPRQNMDPALRIRRGVHDRSYR